MLVTFFFHFGKTADPEGFKIYSQTLKNNVFRSLTPSTGTDKEL